jgi:two-component system response regulator MtrA
VRSPAIARTNHELRQRIARRGAACGAVRHSLAPSLRIVDDRPMARVLIVDDDPDIRALVTYRLSASGYEVISAGDGEAGLAAAREHVPDLVLADWMMPRLTGVEMCTRMRADPAIAGIPVILLTARADDVATRTGWDAGIDEYITKPFSPRELAARVEEILSRKA